MLRLLRADNFKCLDGFELRLDGHALLMGLNGSGKSTVVELLDRLRRFWVAGDKSTACFPGSTRTRWGSQHILFHDPNRLALIGRTKRDPQTKPMTAGLEMDLERLWLILDEPDNYVALQEIQPLLLSLMDLPMLQLIVVSHHPEVIDLMAKDYGYVLAREDGQGPVRVKRWQAPPGTMLPASELVSRGDIDGGA